jgi:tRNA-2-methylthio-N6-dimethylallyladenosine synthase
MNKSDSERIASVLEKMGYKKASNENEADLIVVNMCSVRQSAVDRVYGMAKKFTKIKTQNPEPEHPVPEHSTVQSSPEPHTGSGQSTVQDHVPQVVHSSKIKTLLTGCISKKDFLKFQKFFDFILPIKTLEIWPEFLKKESFHYLPNQREKEFFEKFKCDYLKIESKYEKIFSVFIPISTGCDNFCSYCVVPYTRGPLICRSPEEILKEAEKAVKNGAKEIWLLGQNVNDYKSKIKNQKSKIVNFAKLLKMINDIPGNFWLRFTSPHPKNFSDEFIETMAKCEKFTPYLNLPLQSGDDEILKRMRRNYTAKEYKNLVKKIRKVFKKNRRSIYKKGFPEGFALEDTISISTDIIVGFCSEIEKQFQNTVKLFKELKFDMAYIAQYSPRPHTLAEKLEDTVPQKEKERRWKVLQKILEKFALSFNKKFVGKKVLVLPEEFKDGFLIGKTRHHKTVKFEGKEDLIGNFVLVKVEKAFPWGLKGKLIEK